MATVFRFAGRFNANEYNYGAGPLFPGSIGVTGPLTAAGAQTLTLSTSYINLSGDDQVFPLNTNAPITIGSGANRETVTPTSLTNTTFYQSATPPQLTATFTYQHGTGDMIASGTVGLQEAINAANAFGGGVVVVDSKWYNNGGTLAIIQAASLPANGTVKIEDISTSPTVTYAQSPSSTTVLAVPSAATTATVASQTGVTGTWTAGTVHVVFTYVTADGGETLPSADYTFTATVSLAIGGTGPAAATGAVGYRVYISTVGGSVDYLVPVTAANGTVITCGPIAAFQIGTSFSVATAVTSALALVPSQSTAFGSVQPMPFASPNMAQAFQTVSGPFAVTGVVTAGTALEWGKVQLPTAFLNQVNRTIRLKLFGYYTPVSTATLILTVAVQSVYGTTTTTVFTVTTPASSGTSAANINGEIFLSTAATGATGTIECHGTLLYGGATGTAGLLVAAGDSVQTVSGAVDLTKQDTIVISINSGTANLTQSQLRKLVVEVLA